jgi:hypothetical protein
MGASDIVTKSYRDVTAPAQPGGSGGRIMGMSGYGSSGPAQPSQPDAPTGGSQQFADWMRSMMGQQQQAQQQQNFSNIQQFQANRAGQMAGSQGGYGQVPAGTQTWQGADQIGRPVAGFGQGPMSGPQGGRVLQLGPPMHTNPANAPLFQGGQASHTAQTYGQYGQMDPLTQQNWIKQNQQMMASGQISPEEAKRRYEEVIMGRGAAAGGPGPFPQPGGGGGMVGPDGSIQLGGGVNMGTGGGPNPIQQQIEQGLQERFANPSGFDMTAARRAMEDEAAYSRLGAERQMREQFAQQGLSDSGVAIDANRALQEGFGRTREAGLRDLLLQQGQMQRQGLNEAIGLGTGYIGQQEQALLERLRLQMLLGQQQGQAQIHAFV